MTVWQKRARFAVAVFGIVCAVVVYVGIGRRAPAAAPVPVKRIDPAAVLESTGGNGQRFRGDKRDFEVRWDTQLTYADGTTRMLKVVIRVNRDDGHSYVVTAGEARSTQDQKRLELSSGVHLEANDGFELTADRARYSSDEGTVHSDVPVSFSKGRMRGSGSAVDYNETSEVLTVGHDATVAVVNEAGAETLEFTAGTAVLDRLQDRLTLDGRVHVLRDAQTMDADRAVAHLSPADEFVTFIELRGNAQVAGGGGTLEAMSARDIDLDYTDDGTLLERVSLHGNAGAVLAGPDGTPGRQFTGESLDIGLAADGTISSASGRDNVRMVLPATRTSVGRSVRAERFAGEGAAGRGLTAAHFTEAVEYREDAAAGSPGRVAHSGRLDLALTADSVSGATFTGDVVFEASAFRAQSATARYDPGAGTLQLSGSDNRGLPCVADDQIAVDAQTIDVAVETRRLTAAGTVKTAIRPAGATGAAGSSPCAVARQRAGAVAGASTRANSGETTLPGLLKQDQVAFATADSLEYGGTGQALVYSGHALLVQGETSLRGSVIRIDQERGDLIVTGAARSLIVQGTGEDREQVDGRADEIRYSGSERMVAYTNAAGGGKGPASSLVQVNGPQGDLSANRVEVFMARDDGRAERLEAYQNVTATIGSRKATADRLTYLAAGERYDMRGAGTVPVRIVDGCGEMSGKTLTFYKSDNRISVDGRDVMRTQVKSGSCQQPSTSSR